VTESKTLRKQFGIARAPLAISPDAKVYRKDMEFDHAETKAESWVVLDPKLVHPDFSKSAEVGTLIRANTYNGNLGEKAIQLNPSNCRDIPETKELTKKLKGYTEVAISECPFVVISGDALPQDEAAV
jgi:hypothetical protein